MHEYELVYSVKGMRTRDVVSAYTMQDAKRLVEARYPGSHVVFWSCRQI